MQRFSLSSCVFIFIKMIYKKWCSRGRITDPNFILHIILKNPPTFHVKVGGFFKSYIKPAFYLTLAIVVNSLLVCTFFHTIEEIKSIPLSKPFVKVHLSEQREEKFCFFSSGMIISSLLLTYSLFLRYTLTYSWSTQSVRDVFLCLLRLIVPHWPFFFL